MKKSKVLLLTVIFTALAQPALSCQSYDEAMADLEEQLPPATSRGDE